MIKLLLNSEQMELLPQLRELFPDLRLDTLSGESNSYCGSLIEGPQGTLQFQFLRQHGLLFLDVQKYQQELIGKFFMGVALEGQPILHLHFGWLRSPPHTHAVFLMTRDEQVELYFPADWHTLWWPQQGEKEERERAGIL